MKAMALAPSAIEAGYSVRYFETIGSTNAHALEIAGQGAASGTWVIAGRQTEGRGRLGRQWSSPPGNFYGTLLLIDPCDMKNAAKFGFVAGISLLDAIRTLAPQLRGLALKWPNDVLLNGAKIAGILLEATRTIDNRFSVVIGMGVNLAFHPEDTPYPTANLAGNGYPLAPQAMFTALSASFAQQIKRFSGGQGFQAIREDWLSSAYGLGGRITVRLPHNTIEGIFDAIDHDGRLVLVHDDKPQFINAGDVYFPALSALGA